MTDHRCCSRTESGSVSFASLLIGGILATILLVLLAIAAMRPADSNASEQRFTTPARHPPVQNSPP